MKPSRIAKYFSLAALASLGLLSGASQAGSWDDRGPGRSPGFAVEYSRPGHEPEFRHDFGPGRASLAIDQRQRMLSERIERGIERGYLTRFEARDLTRDLLRIEQIERGFERDGRLDRAEWAELDRLLDRLARDLRQDLRDDDGHPAHRHAWR